MTDFKYCEACLVTNVKMYKMNPLWIMESYTHILSITDFDVCEKYICIECLTLLAKYEEFRLKCCRARDVLTELQKNSTEISPITIKHIQTIDRNKNKLKSHLVQTHVETTTFGTMGIEDKDDRINTKKELCEIKEEYSHKKHFKNVTTELTGGQISNKARTRNKVPKKRGKLKLEHEYKKKREELEIKTEEETDYLFDDIDDEPLITISRKDKLTEIVNDFTQVTNDNDCLKTALNINDKFNDDFVSNETQKGTIQKEKSRSRKRKNNTNSNIEEASLDSVNEKQIKTEVNVIQKSSKKDLGDFDTNFFEDFAMVEVLTPEAAKKEVLLRKESKNYKICPFKCGLCYRGYEGQETFDNHMKKHSKEYGDLECQFCHLRFLTSHQLNKHIVSCHKRKYTCKICPYICFCTSQAKIHIKLHKGNKYPCKDCGEQFSMPNSLAMHRRKKHVAPCACALCGDAFANARGLRAHLDALHRGPQENIEKQGPKCDVCDIHFATDKAWKRHLVLSSRHDISNGCEYCGETFPDEDCLKQHKRVHKRESAHRAFKPGPCSICSKWMSKETLYVSHVTGEHPQTPLADQLRANHNHAVCEICGKTFKKVSFLTYHQRVHDATGVRPHACLRCGRTYSSKATLTAHARTHDARPTPFQCAHCHKTFVFRASRDKHIKTTHLGIRPHSCAICAKAFRSPSDVRVHVRHVHLREPWPRRRQKHQHH